MAQVKKLKVWIKLKDGTARTRRTTVNGFMSTFSHIQRDLENWGIIIVYKQDGVGKLVSYYNYPNNMVHPISNEEVKY